MQESNEQYLGVLNVGEEVIHFSDKEEREKYIADEYLFTSKAYAAYSAATSKDDRERAKATLDSKRIEFAIHMGKILPADNNEQGRYQ